MNDPRDEYLSKIVRGKSFADVGGLWGTVNEKVSVAYQYGANALTMIDIAPPGHELWQLFEERCRVLAVPEVKCLSGDVMALVDESSCPQFEVVHCSGVLYHLPNPLQLLGALRKITREYLVLTSAVIATRIDNEQGALEIPQAASLFVPALQGQERKVLQAYWQRFVHDSALGLTREFASWRSDDFAPWWWLPTVEALKAMCMTAGFYAHAGAYFWNGNAYVLLLSVR
jgi:hypothetical protein